jgi:hypothetical protein
MTSLKQPLKQFKAGNLSLSVWENTNTQGTLKSFSFQRSYKDEKEEWQHTQTLRPNDLPKLALLLQEAYREEVMK